MLAQATYTVKKRLGAETISAVGSQLAREPGQNGLCRGDISSAKKHRVIEVMIKEGKAAAVPHNLQQTSCVSDA